MKEIASALLKAQMEMGNAKKDSKNPFFKSTYASLNDIREACMPALNKHGIVVLQPTVVLEGKNYVKTLLLHESGESLECLTEIVFAKQNDAQAQGSGITYARRYGLQSFVNVGAEDDDGNKASTPPAKPEQRSETIPPPKRETPKSLPELVQGSKEWAAAVKYLVNPEYTFDIPTRIANIKKQYILTKESEEKLIFQSEIN